jgi:hypothetical protein
MDQDFSLTIHEADVHLSGVEIDSAVELCGGGIILHLLCEFGAARPRFIFVTRGVLLTLPVLQP